MAGRKKASPKPKVEVEKLTELETLLARWAKLGRGILKDIRAHWDKIK